MDSEADQIPASEAGFGLVEVIVSMFLLALIALSLLPLLIQAMKSSVGNAVTATSSQLALQQLEQVRATPNNCDDVSALDDAAAATVTDTRGTVYQPHLLVGACPASFPGVVEVRAWVTEDADTVVLSEAVTLVYLATQTPSAP